MNRGNYVGERQSILGRARQRGTARVRRHPTSGSDSHHAASKRALSKGRWGTGAAKGKSKAARVTYLDLLPFLLTLSGVGVLEEVGSLSTGSPSGGGSGSITSA